VSRFAQHTRIRARPGRRDELLGKFLEVPKLQADNPACEVTIVSSSPDDDDVVYLTEVWSSAEEHQRARESPEVQAWAAGMPELVAGAPDVTPLVVEGGKGLGERVR